MNCPHCDAELPPGAERCTACHASFPRLDAADVPEADDMTATVRKQLRRDFHIESLLGRGGMSFVYLARELELGRQVALKVMPLLLSFEQDAADRFRREAKIAASLDHPNIVPVHRIGTTSGFLWYSMKYISGASVGHLVEQEGRLDLSATVGVIEQAARALAHAHRRGVVHRDMKPGNILVDEDGWTVVCDFGIAKAFGSMPLTQTGSTVGTPAYMSPEQCFGRVLDGRSDQYSLAVVAYECLAGRAPFVADSIGEYVHQHCTVPPPPLRQFAPDVPEHVERAILRGLSKAPEDRFPDVVALATAMGAQVREMPRPISIAAIPVAGSQFQPSGPVTPETPGPFGAPRERIRRPHWWRWGAVAAVGVAAAGLYLTTAPPKGATPAGQRPPGAQPDSNGETARPPTGNQEAAAGAGAQSVAIRDTGPSTPPRRPDPTTVPVSRAESTSAPAASPSAPETAMGSFRITTQPVGKLFIDGKPAGESFTVEPIRLAPGIHTIRVEAEGYEPYEEPIEIPAGQEVTRLGKHLTPIGL